MFIYFLDVKNVLHTFFPFYIFKRMLKKLNAYIDNHNFFQHIFESEIKYFIYKSTYLQQHQMYNIQYIYYIHQKDKYIRNDQYSKTKRRTIR